ncbi:MAG: DNA primase, partial [Desulfurococcales archaeon]|nr:DNA primase [Desulfurococcales archaeon]
MKYLIVASFEVNGRVDEHDIIGAIFGQTEGLLGEEFNLEKLQNKDKIGRVYVELKRQGTKTVGKLYIPSNLDRVETAILAAMLETVDRIGPYDAMIKVEEIKDLREEKIKKIIERSKELLQLMKAQEPDIKEIIREVAGIEVAKPRKIKVIEYGPDRLPAAPSVDKSDTIILVEGRADVINLMRYGYDNVIALGGAKEKIPKTILDLAKKKKVIALVDGDRGGLLILKTLLSQADIDYVARAPEGMEVEHLTGKEIAEALAKMRPAEEVKKELGLVEKTAPPEKEQAAQPPPTPVEQPAEVTPPPPA